MSDFGLSTHLILDFSLLSNIKRDVMGIIELYGRDKYGVFPFLPPNSFSLNLFVGMNFIPSSLLFQVSLQFSQKIT